MSFKPAFDQHCNYSKTFRIASNFVEIHFRTFSYQIIFVTIISIEVLKYAHAKWGIPNKQSASKFNPVVYIRRRWTCR